MHLKTTEPCTIGHLCHNLCPDRYGILNRQHFEVGNPKPEIIPILEAGAVGIFNRGGGYTPKAGED